MKESTIRVPLIVVNGDITIPLPTYSMVGGSIQGPKIGRTDAKGNQVPITADDVTAGGYTAAVAVPDYYVAPDGQSLDPSAILARFNRNDLPGHIKTRFPPADRL